MVSSQISHESQHFATCGYSWHLNRWSSWHSSLLPHPPPHPMVSLKVGEEFPALCHSCSWKCEMSTYRGLILLFYKLCSGTSLPNLEFSITEPAIAMYLAIIPFYQLYRDKSDIHLPSTWPPWPTSQWLSPQWTKVLFIELPQTSTYNRKEIPLLGCVLGIYYP